MSATPEPLKKLKISAIRQAISPERYKRSTLRALAWYAFDLALYSGAIAGVVLSSNIFLKLFFGLLAGCAVAFMFVWAHDAAHGALFKSKKVSDFLGTIFMLPSLNMYRLWSFGHNKVHHGFTSFSPVDWIWRPLTPEEYLSKNALGKFIYRLERTPYFCALHYLLRVWLPGMVLFKPEKKDRGLFFMSKLVTLVYFFAASYLAYSYAGGVIGVVAAVLIPFIVFNYFIALFVFLHHTHPDIPFFDRKKEWNAAIGQLYCSTVVRCSKVSELLIHNILIHVPHHVDPKIPFYHLRQAATDIQKEYGQYVHEYRFRWSTVREIFSQCQLYDYERHIWYSCNQVVSMARAGTLPLKEAATSNPA